MESRGQWVQGWSEGLLPEPKEWSQVCNKHKSEVLLSIVGNGGLLSGLAVAALWVHPIGAPSLLPRDPMFAIEF